MFDPSRPTSRWSTAMSITTKSTGSTNQTIPLLNVRKKLFRQTANSYKNFAQRTAKSKHDIEELFKLYYSNDIKFDTFKRQIVTGTRIPTARQNALAQNNLTNSSANAFNSKHCVSREQLSTTDLDCNETTTTKSPSTKRSVQIRVENNTVINSSLSSTHSNLPPLTTTPIIPNLPITSPTTQHNELCDSPLIKSVAFLGDISNESHEILNTKKNKSNNIQHPKSSLLTVPPAPSPLSLLLMNNIRKDPTVLSEASLSTMNSVPPQQQQQSHPGIVTGSAVSVRQRSPTKQLWNKQRTKSSMTVTTNLSSRQPTAKTRSPSVSSPVPAQSDTPEFPVFVGSQRVVSIPSKCSRFVLVSFPEVPLRYNAPSYVERLLLPERFPTLFQNIVQSYDHHLTSIHHHRNTK